MVLSPATHSSMAAVLVLESCREDLGERRGEVLPFPDSCDKLKTGSYKVNKSGLQLQDCTISAGTDVKAGHRIFVLRIRHLWLPHGPALLSPGDERSARLRHELCHAVLP